MAKPPKKETGKALVNWDEELAQAAESQGDARSTSSGKFIGTRGGIFAVGDNEIGNTLNVVVLDYVDENQYYDTDYDQDNPASPVCFAFGREEGTLAPHEAATDPQNAKCTGCPQNAYGSAGNGRKGKACKNVMRLAVITEDDIDDLENAEVHYLKVSTTNVKNFGKFLDQLKNPSYGKKRPSWAVICKMDIKPDRNTMINLAFSRKEDVDVDHLESLKAKHQEQLDKTMFPYQQSAEVEEVAPSAKKSKVTGRR